MEGKFIQCSYDFNSIISIVKKEKKKFVVQCDIYW